MRIYIFKSIDDAVSRLNRYHYKETHPVRTVKEIIHDTSGASTFRTFRGIEYPSKIYRHWAHRYFNKIVSDMNNAKTQETYDKRLFYLVSTLQKEWAKKSGTGLDFGRAAKQINLLARDIAGSINPDCNKFYVSNRKVQKFLHVPLDSFCLRPLRIIIHDLTDKNVIPIPSNATMNHVKSKKHYMVLQKAVRTLCKRAKRYTMIYEYWSGKRTHKSRSGRR